MEVPKFYDLSYFGYTECVEFTDIQGLGNVALYNRYDSLKNIVNIYIEEEYRHFFALPFEKDSLVLWYVKEWTESPKCLSDLRGAERSKYDAIKANTLSHYFEQCDKMSFDEQNIIRRALKYIDDKFIYCFDDIVVLVVWGMTPNLHLHKENGSWLKGMQHEEEKIQVDFLLGNEGKFEDPTLRRQFFPKGHVIEKKDVPVLVSGEGYHFVGWSPEPIGVEVSSKLSFTATFQKVIVPKQHRVTFSIGSQGELKGQTELFVEDGHLLSSEQLPEVVVNDGFEFMGWQPSVESPIYRDVMFEAEMKDHRADIKKSFNEHVPIERCECLFLAGEHGRLEGYTHLEKQVGESLYEGEVPKVIPNQGYDFKGWDISPLDTIIEGRTLFTAQYQPWPWYKKLWRMFSMKGCLKWLLWILLILLIGVILFFLLRSCNEDSKNKIVPIDSRRDSIGNIVDDNGIARPITSPDGVIPDSILNDSIAIVAPIDDGDGKNHKEDRDNLPSIVDNRLNIFFEDANADIQEWCKQFKAKYPSEKYSVIGIDPNVPWVQIRIPENERNEIREKLPKEITFTPFLILDETFLSSQNKGMRTYGAATRGWHLNAIEVEKAWQLTKGSNDVVVAVVDNGISSSHEMFEHGFYRPYNVFKRNRQLSEGDGHGTHVAALAVGSDKFVQRSAQGLVGASGVAPRCKLMPVQVSDNKFCTIFNEIAGIIYAINNGADIVNISLGPGFPGLSGLTGEEQRAMAEFMYINEQKVWKRIISLANRHNVILVFAAGNDAILANILPECREAHSSVKVAAVNEQYRVAQFSNRHEGCSVSAPGTAIYSAYKSGVYEELGGTSMAAPIVSGTLALMRSIQPQMTVKQALYVLQHTGRVINHNRNVPPMVIAGNAVRMVQEGLPSDKDIDAWEKEDPHGNIVDDDIQDGTISDGGSGNTINDGSGGTGVGDGSLPDQTNPSDGAGGTGVGDGSLPDQTNPSDGAGGTGVGDGSISDPKEPSNPADGKKKDLINSCLRELLRQKIKQRDKLNEEIENLKKKLN